MRAMRSVAVASSSSRIWSASTSRLGSRSIRVPGTSVGPWPWTEDEYQARIGWGHSRVSDALLFARRSEAARVLLFHHDPLHTDDELDALHDRASMEWEGLGGSPAALAMAVEGAEIDLAADAPARVRIAL